MLNRTTQHIRIIELSNDTSYRNTTTVNRVLKNEDNRHFIIFSILHTILFII